MNGPSEKAWHKLDNAAIIFPPTSKKTDTKVFRLSCELIETVNESVLQQALERTIEDFPSFRYVLKQGLFWYYLEQSDLKPIVKEENAPPCSAIYRGGKTLLFEVSWYGRRINLEAYHALTDGTGAMQFLKALVVYYLKLAHPDAMSGVTGIDYDASDTQKMSDSFRKYYDGSKSKQKIKKTAAFQIKGARETERRLKIIEGTVPTKALLSKAREYGTTATVLVTALFMQAIYKDMSVHDRKKPVAISVPVNLRNYFASKSTLNFFSVVDVKYDFSAGGDDLESIIQVIKTDFAERLNEDYLQNRLNALLKIERNFLVRAVPLAIKDILLNVAYSVSMREVTASVSNLGRVEMPGEAEPYIRLFDVFTSTNKIQICMCSYGDNMNITFSSAFVGTDIQRRFFRQLSQMGIPVQIAANRLR